MATKEPIRRPDWLPASIWPFQLYAVTTPRTTVVISEAGVGAVTMLFVHTGMWSFIWRDVIADLAADFRCITIDAPGTGLSPYMRKAKLTFDENTHAIECVVKHLDLAHVVLVIHSLGGPPALAAFSGMSERVRGIVALNTFGWKPANTRLCKTMALIGHPLVRELDAAGCFVEKLAASTRAAGRNLTRCERAIFMKGIGTKGTRAFHAYMASARTSDGLYARAESGLCGPLRHLPVLTIFGERNDPFAFQKRWKEFFPRAAQIVVPRGNHFPMCDNAPLVARAIRTWHDLALAHL